MKKIIFAFLLIGITINSFGAAVVADDYDTTVSHSSVAINAAYQSVLFSQIALQQQQIAEANAARMKQTAILNTVAKGVIECNAAYHKNNNGDYVYDGCEGRDDNLISINDYFNKYKPENANQIVMIVFDNHNYYFDIYYN